jgi:hypothetical protein
MQGQGRGLPQRREELLSEWVGDEVVVLDGESGQAHCLSGAAAAIWERCDGQHDVSALAQSSGQERSAVETALDELARLGLLGGGDGEPRGLTRRAAAQRAVQVGAGALVLSVALPSVASAASRIANGQPAPNCTAANHNTAADTECASGECYRTGSTRICVPVGCVVFGGNCSGGKACCSGACTLNTCLA